MIYAYIQDGRHRQINSTTPPDADWWIRRDDVDHSYVDSDGCVYTSVTRWLEEMEGKPFDAAVEAARLSQSLTGEYTGKSPEQIVAAWEDAAVVAQGLHAAIESYINNSFYATSIQGLPYVKQVEQFKAWRADNLGEHVRSEMLLWSRSALLAGTADLVSWRDDVGARIDDIKTWKIEDQYRVREASRQISLYALMLGDMLDCDVTIGGVLLWENYYNLRVGAELRFIPIRDRRGEMMSLLRTRENQRDKQREGQA